jgi:hypothetical protein
MKREYDFAKAKRGPVMAVPKGKTRITIRLDEDVIDWFRNHVKKAGGGNYQSLTTMPYDSILRMPTNLSRKRFGASFERRSDEPVSTVDAADPGALPQAGLWGVISASPLQRLSVGCLSGH